MNSNSFDQTVLADDVTLARLAEEELDEGAWSGNTREVPAWAVSLGVHAVVLALLASISTVTGMLDTDIDITSSIEEIQDELEYKFEATAVDQVGNMSDANKLSPSQLAATSAGKQPEKQMQEQLEEEILTVEVPVTDAIDAPHKDELLAELEIRGQALDHPGGVDGAVDRMSFEIAGSLRENKTLVIWLFDESISVRKRREAVAERFKTVYDQLGLLKADTSDGALKTAIVGFAEQTNIYTPEPISDPQKALEIVKQIKDPNSAKENVFTAVEMVAKKWSNYRTRLKHNVMLVIVTDERGDDYARVEEVAPLLARYGMRVYCIGNASPFGREVGWVTMDEYTYPDGFVAQNVRVKVDQGPETAFPEVLDLPYWGTNGAGMREMTASYGPYALTRLCAETKGMFLVAAESERGPRFDPAIMRDYAPDYRPIRDLTADIQKNQAKMSLVNAAKLIMDEGVPPLALEFRADTDNALRTEIADAQRPAAVFDDKLTRIQAILEQGEKDRKKLTDLRWRAAYDVAVGRLCALRVRFYGYNVVMAAMRSQPKVFEKQGNNAWRLVPAREIDGGPSVRKLAQTATEYLTRVVDEHPGTPWAAMAERELSTPMGWAWEEFQKNFNETGNVAMVNGKRVLLADDEEIDRKTGKRIKKVVRPTPEG